MFKDLLLIVLVSVVWSTAHSTYILHDQEHYGLFGANRFGAGGFSSAILDTFDSPLHQSHFSSAYDDDDDNDNIDFSQLHHSPLHSFSGFIGDSLQIHSPNSDQKWRPVSNQHNKQSYDVSNLDQQHIEIRNIASGYHSNQPQILSQNTHHTGLPNILGLVINQGKDYSSGSVSQDDNKYNQNSHSVKTIQTNIDSKTQQRNIETGFKEVSGDKATDYGDQKTIDYGNQKTVDYDNQKAVDYDNQKTVDYDNQKTVEYGNQKAANVDEKQNGAVGLKTLGYININGTDYKLLDPNIPILFEGGHPEVYHHDHSNSGYSHVHQHDNEEYSEIPINIRSVGNSFNYGIPLHINFPLNGHGHVDLSHGNLLKLNDETLYQIGHGDQNVLNNILKLDLRDIKNYDTYRNNDSDYETSKNTASDSYSDKNTNNYEQKTVDVGLKTTPDDYKNIDSAQAPDYSEQKTVSDSNLEQKSVDDVKSPEQKPVEIDLKSNIDEYSPPDSYSKDPEPKIEQKSVPAQSDSYDSESDEYDGIGEKKSPKYPSEGDEKYGTKVEQKDLEVKSYQEIKSSVKSLQQDVPKYDSKKSVYQRPIYAQQPTYGGRKPYSVNNRPSSFHNSSPINTRLNSNYQSNSPVNTYFNSGSQTEPKRNYPSENRPNKVQHSYSNVGTSSPTANYPKPISLTQTYSDENLRNPPTLHRRFTPMSNSYSRLGETSGPNYSGPRSYPAPSSIPKYQESVARGPAPRYPSYPTATQPLQRSANYPAGRNLGSSTSYQHRNLGSPSASNSGDYSSGIGAKEDSGKRRNLSPKPYDAGSRSYTRPLPPSTEQKPYTDELASRVGDIPDNGPSVVEYSGIGEIGSRSEKYPAGRYSKPSIKTTSKINRVKGKDDSKQEQKYLPITAALSNSNDGKKPVAKQYGNIKTAQKKEPEKVEQTDEQDLVYEGLLSGSGPQNNLVASSGFGFDRSPSNNRRPDASSYKPTGDDENLPPMPYEFEFEVQDDEHGADQYRQEKMDDNGFLTGRYGYRDPEGIFRQVEYEASKDGFKVNKLRTNEPGTDDQDPADVQIDVVHQKR